MSFYRITPSNTLYALKKVGHRKTNCIENTEKFHHLITNSKTSMQNPLEDQSNIHRLSNFEILKQQIHFLQNEEFLAYNNFPRSKQKCSVEYSVKNEFYAGKKLLTLNKYRQSLKDGLNRRKNSETFKQSDKNSKIYSFYPKNDLNESRQNSIAKSTLNLERVAPNARKYFQDYRRHHKSQSAIKVLLG